MQPKPINILTIQFANEISQREIPLFRGAIIHSLGNKSILFHNHDGDKFRYAYPLIQYKRIKGKAAIVCIDLGLENISELFTSNIFQCEIGKKTIELRIENIHLEQEYIGCTEQENTYRLRHWIPLNTKNYQQYQKTDSLIEKISILEKVLTGNILSFLKGVTIHQEEMLDINITEISHQQLSEYKKIRLMTFDIEFHANISLPSYIGIGKNASIGYGVLTKIR